MNSSPRSKRKSARHAISGLLAQPTPGTSSGARLSKSFDARRDSEFSKPGFRKLRERRSVGSAEINTDAVDLEEDKETPRTHIEEFLKNADTNPSAGGSSVRKSGRLNPRPFTRTPKIFTKKSPAAANVKVSDLSLPSPGGLFTPRTNIEQFLQGSGSEHSARQRSTKSVQKKSDTKILSANRSKNWAQRISLSPLYQSGTMSDSSATAEGSFKTLQRRKSFRIPEPPGFDDMPRKFSQRTPDRKIVKDSSRLSKSEPGLKVGSGKWAQRVSTSPLNYSNLEMDALDDSNASPNRFFKHSRLRRSFHMPEVVTRDGDRRADPKSDANAPETNEMDNQYEERDSQFDTLKNQSNKSREDTLVQSPVPSMNSNVSREMKNKMKVYDLSDGSSDSDLSPLQASTNESVLKKSTTPHSGSASVNKTITNRNAPTPTSSLKSSGQKRLRSSNSPHFITPLSIPKASHANSAVHDSVSSSKRRRLSWGENEGNHIPALDEKDGESSPFEANTKIPFAPPSSTPVKRHIPIMDNDDNDTPETNFSHQRQAEREEIVSVLVNATLQGISPIRSVEEDKDESQSKALGDMQEDIGEGFVSSELEPVEDFESEQTENRQNSNNGTSTKAQGTEMTKSRENESSSNSPSMKTPHIDMSKKPPSQSARRLNLLTPFRENPDNLKRDAKRPTNSRKKSADTSFVSRKTIKFYAELFSKGRVDKEVIDELVKVSEELWEDNLKTAEGYALHAGRKTITEADVVLLMKVQRMVGSTEELHDLIREYLPMDLRCELIPTVHAHFPNQ